MKQRWWDVAQWIDDAGPGHWNNLDAINVGVGEMDGLTRRGTPVLHDVLGDQLRAAVRR